MKKTEKLIPLTHPGKHLSEFMEDYGLTQYRLAKELGIQQTRISQIIKGRRSISADTAIRIGRFFETSAEMWLNLQSQYDLESAERMLGDEILKNITPITRNNNVHAQPG